jgi:hypothetical protein
MFGQGVWW